MNTTPTADTAPVRVAANYAVTKRLGNWTTAGEFQVRACSRRCRRARSFICRATGWAVSPPGARRSGA